MLEVLYQFFYDLFYFSDGLDNKIGNFSIQLSNGDDIFNGLNIYEYLAIICSLIAWVFIFVLCCLFVYKIVRLIGGLIR